MTTWLLPRLGEGETGILLGGVLPLALLGALRRKSRPYLWAAGYLAAAFLLLPFVAWAYDPRPNRIPFFDATVRRLLIYALPVLLPLAALAVDRLLPHLKAPEPVVPRPPLPVCPVPSPPSRKRASAAPAAAPAVPCRNSAPPSMPNSNPA